MATKTVDLSVEFSFTPKGDIDTDRKSVIHYRQMDPRLKAYALGRIREANGTIDATFSLAIDIFSVCVTRYDNLIDKEGNQVELKFVEKFFASKIRKAIQDDILDSIPEAVIMETFDKIFDSSILSEGEKKN